MARNFPVYSVLIQTELNIKKSYTSSLLSELENDKIIKRIKEGKKKRIELTQKGFEETRKGLLLMLTDNEIMALQNIN